MKGIGFIGAAVLLLLQGAVAPAYAQGEGRNEQQGNHAQKGARANRDQRGRQHTQQGATVNQPGRRRAQQGATVKQRGRQRAQQGTTFNQSDQRRAQQGATFDQPEQQRPQRRVQPSSTPERRHVWQQRQQANWNQHRARSFNSERRTWGQRGGYHGYRIPATAFGLYFGPERSFRVYDRPFRTLDGRPSFRYGGYWITVLDPYPEYWGPAWYQTDDVYVSYVDDGYYLFNRMYPDRPGLAVSIGLSR